MQTDFWLFLLTYLSYSNIVVLSTLHVALCHIIATSTSLYRHLYRLGNSPELPKLPARWPTHAQLDKYLGNSVWFDTSTHSPPPPPSLFYMYV
ncbi:hypothetical protein F4823DRAFT_588907, partial [Ustulina deusta]